MRIKLAVNGIQSKQFQETLVSNQYLGSFCLPFSHSAIRALSPIHFRTIANNCVAQLARNGAQNLLINL